ncbi:MAG: ATP-binding protein [Candidatus Lokiarchaeota archaeon]|nr:ATP-binding protein [Candidatus Lokiarchaeota archaeon]
MEIEIGIKNFKSIKNTSLNLRNGLNILVGPNGSGKSCIFSSLKFLKDIFNRGTAQAMASAGGPKQVFHRGSKNIEISIGVDYGERSFKKKKYKHKLFWSVTISQKGKDKIAEITKEYLEINVLKNDDCINIFRLSRDINKNGNPYLNVKLDNTKNFGRDLFSNWNYDYKNKEDISSNFGKDIRKRLKRFKNLMDDVPVITFLSNLDTRLNYIFYSLNSLNEYNIIPEIARIPTEQLPYAHMEPNGSRVAEVINALETKQFHKIRDMERFYYTGRYDLSGKFGYMPTLLRSGPSQIKKRSSILGTIQSELNAAVHSIDGVTTEIDPSTGKRFVIFKSGKDRFNSKEISDGTIKWLCILISIYVPYSYIYLIEEPENFLHPWMQQKLIYTMREQATENNTIFLLTTHSTTILNSANPEEIKVVSYKKSGTKVQELKKLKELKDFLTSSDFNLGDLWVSGAISGVPVNE